MPGSKITLDQLRHVAKLARLKLTPAEEKLYLRQLGPVLAHIDNLNQVDTSTVDPTFQVTSLSNIFRLQDLPCLSSGQALANAPKSQNGFFVSPQTVDK